MPISFESFQAAARYTSDLSKDEAPEIREQFDADNYAVGGVPAGRVYPGFLTIEDWERAPIEGCRYYLIIGNCNWLSNDVAELEAHLFEYYLAECAELDQPDLN
jgi:hypothetical protein